MKKQMHGIINLDLIITRTVSQQGVDTLDALGGKCQIYMCMKEPPAT